MADTRTRGPAITLLEEHMRVIPAPPPPAGPLRPIPASPCGRESIAVTWFREITTAVSDALDTDVEHAGYLLTMRPDLPVPHTLHAVFTVAGHQVRVTVVWDDPRREPGFALTVDDRPIALDTTSLERPAAVLAYATWSAITAPTAADSAASAT